MDKALLSELCTICHTDVPKYRCPRCKIQTCSLPCYKRHQQRASCSGKRDPTTYVKKSQWATAAGIDHDYNYLKGVERNIDDASQDARDRGIGVEAATSKGAAKAWQPHSGLQRYLTRHQIRVERAPTGLSRQKTNQTRVTKSGKVMWTVEWIGNGGAVRDVQNDSLESATLGELYSSLQAEKRNTRAKRRNNQPERGVKRSHDHLSQDPPEEAKLCGQITAEDESRPGEEEEENSHHHHHGEASEEEAPACQLHYYLHRPATASASRVLIPVARTATLTECLESRNVQEYPTIYVFPFPDEAGALPAGFMLEEEYLRHVGGASSSSEKDSTPGAAADQVLDAKGILDMLKRDITR